MEPWKELLVYWQAKHVDGRPPSRQDIDPVVDLPHLAANLLIADVVPEGYRYRLVGSAIVERHKEKMTGSSRFKQRVRSQLIESFDAVRDQRKPRLLKTGEPQKLLVGVFYDRRFDVIDQI